MFRFVWDEYLILTAVNKAIRCLAFLLTLSVPGAFHLVHLSGATFVPICKIQGAYFTSPYEGQELRTQGIVYADMDDQGKKGFFLQSENCDGDSATSDGIFVYLGEKIDIVTSGDQLEATGTIQEYYARTELVVTPESVTVISSGNQLPQSVELNPPFENEAADHYFESLEGMHVALPEVQVVGPTNNDGETWVVRSDTGIDRVFQGDPRGTGEVVGIDDEGLYQIYPQAKVGDHLQELTGGLDFTLGAYRMQLTKNPILYPLNEAPPIATIPVIAPPQFSVGTYNLANLFDTNDDPLTDDSVLSTAEYYRHLRKYALTIHATMGEPDFLALQEAENLSVLQALVTRPEIETEYSILWQDSPDIRGIDIALLYRTDKAILLSQSTHQGCTSLADGLGPDGNLDMENPANSPTCDVNGNGELDGNRLFSRPPLVVHFQICPVDCASDLINTWFIVNHWKSKMQDTTYQEYTLPRRIQQAEFIAGIIQDIIALDPTAHVILCGDLNDYPDSQPIVILKDAGMTDLTAQIDQPDRYTFIHQGVSQVLDYIFYRATLSFSPQVMQPVHVNADFPAVFEGVADTVYRSSDHDPVVSIFSIYVHHTYLPLVTRN